MISIFTAVSLTYIIGSLLGYFIHKSLHSSWTMAGFRAHSSHHNIQYPPNDYFSDVYRGAGKNNSVYLFLIALSPPILFFATLVYLGYIGWIITTIILIEAALIGFLNDYIHDSFHIYNHWLNRSIFKNIFRKLNKLHMIHHIDQSKNFGIFDPTWDYIFKSLKS